VIQLKDSDSGGDTVRFVVVVSFAQVSFWGLHHRVAYPTVTECLESAEFFWGEWCVVGDLLSWAAFSGQRLTIFKLPVIAW
jgi:hypothetical protein